MTNQTKHILLFVGMLFVLFVLSSLDSEFYRTLMLFIGSWQIGSWCSAFARKTWPRPGTDDTEG